MPNHIFISDLHLDKNRSHHHVAFYEFCDNKLKSMDYLYILGDFFEVWLGDDMDIDNHRDVIDKLRQLTNRGVNVCVQHGNRDFLLGSMFSEATGVVLLPDEHIIEINNQRVLLMHGDSLCTDDADYQQIRVQTRHPDWQQAFLAKSPDERKALALTYRQQSKAATAEKSDKITDVNEHSVVDVMATHQVKTLIHGHTHRPMVHQKNGLTRIVLSDWTGFFDYLRWPEQDTWHFLRQPI